MKVNNRKNAITWTEEELDFLNNNYMSLSRNDIARILNKKKSSIDSKMKTLGLKRGKIRVYSLNEKYFENIDSEEKAYWLGFLYADGCVIDKKLKNGNNNGKKLKISLKRSDFGHLEKFNKSICSNYPIRNKISKINDFEYSIAELSISNTEFVNSLIKQNIVPRKTYENKYPIVCESLMRHFLRGYIDGDGYIGRIVNEHRIKYSIEICSYGKDILEMIQKYLSKNKIDSKIYLKSKNRKDYRMMIFSIDSVVKLLTLLYSDSTIHLTRKFTVAQEILTEQVPSYK